jgi:thiamine biosynthesis lipoprotein
MFAALSTLRSRLAGPSRAAQPSAGWCRREEAIMGTAIVVELWAESRGEGEAAVDAVMAEMRRIDRAMSPHKPDSELSLINREAGQRPVRLSAEMFALVDRAIEFSRWSDGAFDISYASVGHLYDYRAGVAPDDAAVAQARQAIGWQQLLLDRAAGTLRFGQPGMRIDLGGFAKGHAVDRSDAIMRERGIAHAMDTAGGDC